MTPGLGPDDDVALSLTGHVEISFRQCFPFGKDNTINRILPWHMRDLFPHAWFLFLIWAEGTLGKKFAFSAGKIHLLLLPKSIGTSDWQIPQVAEECNAVTGLPAVFYYCVVMICLFTV